MLCENSVQPRRRPSTDRVSALRAGSSTSPGHLREEPGRRLTVAGLVLLDEREIGVLEAGPTHLEVLHVVAELLEQAPHERRRVGAPTRCGVRRMPSTAPAPPPSSRCDRPSTVSSATIRPAASTSTRSASFSASSRSWVVSRIVVPSASASLRTSPWNSRRACGSKPGRGLVEEQQLGPPDDPDRDVEAAPLPARQRGDLAVGEVGQADGLQEQVDVVRASPLGRRVRARSSRRAGSAAGAASSAGGRATTGGRRRCAPASPRPRGPGPGPAR